MQKNELAIKLASLKEREQKTNTQETRIRTQQENIQAQLKAALAEMEEKYGTKDLAALRQKFAKSREADAQAVSDFESGLMLREEIIQTITDSVDSLRLN